MKDLYASSRWIRIDETRVGEYKQPPPRPGQRVYGMNGDLWPRLTLRVTCDDRPTLLGTERVISISCSIKVGLGSWWGGEPIPADLLGELREMLAGDIPPYEYVNAECEDGEVE